MLSSLLTFFVVAVFGLAFGALMIVCGATVVVLSQAVSKRRALARLKRMQGQLGLPLQPGRNKLAGTIDGCNMHVSRAQSDGRSWWVVEVLDLPEGLAMGRQMLVGQGDDREIGDDTFDQRFWLHGHDHDLLGLLDADTRAALSRTFRYFDDRLLHGKMVLRRRFLVRRELQAIAATANRLRAAMGRQLGERLLDLMRDDPIPGVRYRALEVLLERRPSVTRSAALKLARESHDLELLARALPYVSEDELSEMLRLLLAGPVEVQRRALQGLPCDRREFSPWVEDLVRVQLGPGRFDRRIAISACDYLAGGEAGGAEELLLGLLAGDDYLVSIAAATALSRVGTLVALPALRSHAGLLVRSDVEHACDVAIQQIEQRLGLGAVGALSLASTQGGGLSLAEASQTGPPAGALSEAT